MVNLKSTFPHASKSFLEINGSLPATVPQPIAPDALGDSRKRKGEIRGRIRVRYRLSSVRPFDTDNLAGAIKIGQDCLVAVGLLPADDPFSIEVSFAQIKVNHFADEKLEIEIKP